MRAMITTLVLLFAAGGLAANLELPSSGPSASAKRAHPDDGWRRTATGWEQRSKWNLPDEQRTWHAAAARIHPLTIALFQLLVSLLALSLAGPLPAFRRPCAASPSIPTHSDPHRPPM